MKSKSAPLVWLRKMLGRLLGKVAYAGIWIMWKLRLLARRMGGRKYVPVNVRKIILSEMLELAKGIQRSNFTSKVDES